MLSINYNPSVLRAQNNLMHATNSVSGSLERMSTGFRINSAKDDAAGLYIATGLDTQIRGLKQAQKNTEDGISLLNTAEGSLSNMKDMLQRIRDLSVQGANGIYDDLSRNAMQDEAEALIAEIQRVYNSTTFNGKNLFMGTESSSITTASWKVNTNSTPQKNSINSSGISGVSALSSDTDAVQQITEQEAIDLKKQIEEGKISFEDAAKNHSLCPSSEYGGDLGFNGKGRLDKDFEKVMFSLKKRIISDPIKTKAGWHLAKVYEIKYFSDKENFSHRYAISTEEAIKLLNK